jgi:hypothetical protein
MLETLSNTPKVVAWVFVGLFGLLCIISLIAGGNDV